MAEIEQLLHQSVSSETTAPSADGIDLLGGHSLAATLRCIEPVKMEGNDELYRRARSIFDCWIQQSRIRCLLHPLWNQTDEPELFDAFLIFEELAAREYGKAYYPLAVLHATRDLQALYERQHSLEDRWSQGAALGNWVQVTVRNRGGPFFAKALSWCRTNQSSADPEVLCDLGEMHHFGFGTREDTSRAIAVFLSAAELGFWRAQVWLFCRHAGDHRRWGQIAADQGNAYAQYAFGSSSCDVAGLEYLERSAEQGLLGAQLDLAGRYRRGYGGASADLTLAIRWYRKAAQQDAAEAGFHLGDIYQNEVRDGRTAFEWYEMSAQAEEAESQLRLAHCYDAGVGVPQDLLLAAHWYQRSAAQGPESNWAWLFAMHGSAQCHDYGKGVPRDPAKAVELYKYVAMLKHTFKDIKDDAISRLRALGSLPA